MLSLLLGVSALLLMIALKKYKRTAGLPAALVVVVVYISIMAIWHVAAHSIGTSHSSFVLFC